jgi:YHS domain-containing protein
MAVLTSPKVYGATLIGGFAQDLQTLTGKHPSSLGSIQKAKSPDGRMLMTKDPVCNMDIDEKQTNLHSEYAGRKYHFCSEECKDTFDNQPERYATTAA